MNLKNWGYKDNWEEFRIKNQLTDFEPGRVISEHRERYVVVTESGEVEAEITGNIRFSATSREDFPAVGDWVLLIAHSSEFAIIHKILPRYSVIKRKSIRHFGEVQLIATNIDYAFIVQAAGHDFNINRTERYLTICYDSGVEPIILLTKTDLISVSEKETLIQQIQNRINKVPIFAISNETKDGYTALKSIIQKEKTYCMLGSSGVGKSTLINNLSEMTVMQTASISESTQKGRHTTSHREIILLENGGIFIDNPGMREVGIADSSAGIEITFDHISEIANDCRYKDCKHINELGCAVLEAVDSGMLDKESYNNFLKMEKEKAHFETSVHEKRKKEKHFGKILKDYNRKNIKQRGR